MLNTRIRSLGVFCATILVGGITTPLLAYQYSIKGLGALGANGESQYSKAYGINDKGQVVGISSTANGDYHAFLYSNGNMQDLTSANNVYSWASSINASGQVVVNSTPDLYRFHASVYSNGAMKDLGSLPVMDGNNHSTIANAINNSGQVVGMSYVGSFDEIDKPFIYSNTNMKGIDVNGYPYDSDATAINNLGQVVGSSLVMDYTQAGNIRSQAFLYSGSGGSANSFSNNSPGWAYSSARDINDLTQIIGNGSFNGVNSGYLYNKDNTIALNFNPNAINNSGLVVGDSYSSLHAMLYTNGAIQDLNALINPNSGWHLTSATGINDLGQIIGAGSFNGLQQAFMLSPVPEPETYMMMIGGIGLVGFATRRKKKLTNMKA